jgi:hypothetical protein
LIAVVVLIDRKLNVGVESQYTNPYLAARRQQEALVTAVVAI